MTDDPALHRAAIDDTLVVLQMCSLTVAWPAVPSGLPALYACGCFPSLRRAARAPWFFPSQLSLSSAVRDPGAATAGAGLSQRWTCRTCCFLSFGLKQGRCSNWPTHSFRMASPRRRKNLLVIWMPAIWRQNSCNEGSGWHRKTCLCGISARSSSVRANTSGEWNHTFSRVHHAGL